MINPVNYDYNTTIYPYLRTNSNHATVQPVTKVPPVRPVNENTRIFVGKSEALDCQTCKSRTYVDGSDEGNVSFKSPAHISPEASYAKVTSHEQEHVANAIRKGSEPGAKLISASVTLKTDICPECGKSYIAGGETFTQIKYNVNNPYEKSRKSLDESMLKGMNFDAVA